MNRRKSDLPHPWSPSPYFKAVILSLGLLLLLLGIIFDNVAKGAEPARAPVVTAGDTAGVMTQTGWFTYESKPDVVVLYCVPEGAATLTCVVFVATDKGNAVVLVDGIKATEQET